MPEDESYLNKRGLTHFWENIDDIKQNKLTAGAGISITNDVISATGGGTADAVDWGHITGSMSNQTDLTTALAAKANSADLATVATSGDYDDLTDKPTIGTGLLTLKNNNVVIGTFSANSTSARTITVTTPTKTSDLTNDSGFLTSYTETDPIYSASPAAGITAADISSWDAKSDFSGSYNDLTDKPTIPTVNNGTLTIQKNGTNVQTFTANQSGNVTANIVVPTATSDLQNDGSDGTSTYVEADDLATVATSGSYNDLSNKPTIPTVNNATLTIQKNSTNVATFTANASSNVTANIEVPTYTAGSGIDITNNVISTTANTFASYSNGTLYITNAAQNADTENF